MNRIYRLVWNHKLHAFVVGSEFAAACGKRSGRQKLVASGLPLISGICGVLALALASPAHAGDPRLEDLQVLVAKYATPAPQVTIGPAAATVTVGGASVSAGAGASASLGGGSTALLSASASASASASVTLPTVGGTVRKVAAPVSATVVPVVAKVAGPQPAQLIAGIAEHATQGVGALVKPVDQIVASKGAVQVDARAGVTAVIGGVLPGKENAGQPLHEGVKGAIGLVEGTVKGVVTTVGGGLLGDGNSALTGLIGGVLPGKENGGNPVHEGVKSTVGLVEGTVKGVLGDGKSGVTGLLAGVLPGKDNSGNPVREGLQGAVGLVEGTVKDVVKGTGVGDLLQGVVGVLKPVLNGAGEVVGGTVKAVTGSEQLAAGLEGAVKGVAGGLQQITDNVVDTNLTGVVQGVGNTVNTVVGSTVGGVTGTVDGLVGGNSGLGGLGNIVTGITGGVTGGLTNVVGGLTGTPPANPAGPGGGTGGGAGGGPLLPAAAPSAATGLIIGNGGALGSVGQVVGPTLASVLGGDGYVRNGGLTLNSANVTQTFGAANVLGIPLVNLSPVGKVLDALGGVTTGSNSNLTLVGGVTSESYIQNINKGGNSGLLGLLLPDKAPGWASKCADVLGLGIATIDCWAVPAAQNYQVLIGDGAFANGSKEVVIGTGARHELPKVDASTVFTDPNRPGVPTSDYDARLGHSVVIGDSATGTANAQTLLGAGATSNKANSVALGYKSDASRGGSSSYTAFGLSAPQTSIGEVAVGSDGRNRQITHVAAGSQDNDAVNVGQLKGALAGINGGAAFAVTYELDAGGNPDYGKVNLKGTGAGTVIGNLAAGQVSAGSKEAVNGSQLHAVAQSTATRLGGGATVAGDGTVSAPTYTINTILSGGQMQAGTYRDVGSAFDAVSQSLANLRGDGGTPGSGGADPLAVRYQAGADGKPTNKLLLSGDGSGAAVAVGNVAAGAVASGSLDAVNGDQLHQTNDAAAQYLGAGTRYDSTSGQWSGPQYQITKVGGDGSTSKVTATDVGQAFDAMDGSLNTINQRITNIQQGGTGSEYFSVNSSKAPAAASGQDSVAAGPAAVASGDQSVAIGDAAQATAAGSVALGAGSKADRANTVSVGSEGAERQVVNVADGSQATDAVNVRQLQASQQGTLRYDQNSDGSNNYNSVTLGKAGGGATVVRNVAAGTADTDAVNVAQLNQGLGKVMDWSKSYTDQRFNDIGRDIKRVDDRASAGIASAMAIAGLPQPTEAGRRMASVAAGSFNGESGMAVGVSGVSDGGRWIYKLSGTTNTRGEGGVSVGAGFQW